MPTTPRRSAVQDKILEVYKVFKALCEKHDLRFFAIGGTAIGAVRHKGFIPWDDDMDLGMPVEDYEKFVRIAKSELKPPYSFTEIPCMGGKVFDASTTFLEVHCLGQKDNYYGVFVDIFPLVGVPDDEVARERYLKEMLEYHCESDLWYHYRKLSKYSKQELWAWRDSLMKRYNIDKVKYMAEFSINHNFVCETAGILEQPNLVMPFEDTDIPISRKFDADLLAHYGDYMKIPPKEQQLRHEEYGLVDLEVAATEYYKKMQDADKMMGGLLTKKHYFEGKVTQNSNLTSLELSKVRALLEQRENEIRTLNEEMEHLCLALNDARNHGLRKVARFAKRHLSNLTKRG